MRVSTQLQFSVTNCAESYVDRQQQPATSYLNVFGVEPAAVSGSRGTILNVYPTPETGSIGAEFDLFELLEH